MAPPRASEGSPGASLDGDNGPASAVPSVVGDEEGRGGDGDGSAGSRESIKSSRLAIPQSFVNTACPQPQCERNLYSPATLPVWTYKAASPQAKLNKLHQLRRRHLKSQQPHSEQQHHLHMNASHRVSHVPPCAQPPPHHCADPSRQQPKCRLQGHIPVVSASASSL